MDISNGWLRVHFKRFPAVSEKEFYCWEIFPRYVIMTPKLPPRSVSVSYDRKLPDEIDPIASSFLNISGHRRNLYQGLRLYCPKTAPIQRQNFLDSQSHQGKMLSYLLKTRMKSAHIITQISHLHR